MTGHDTATLPVAPLAGRTLVVMRPREQAGSLCERIRAAGGEALLFPVIAVGPALDPTPLEALIERLDAFDLAFFVSPTAANAPFTHRFISLTLSLPPSSIGQSAQRESYLRSL
mgnify:CR=1 FL=1